MPKTSTKQKNLWTEQHEVFCLENKVPHAAQRLWQWLLWEAKLTEEVEPDLTDFNAWIEETRGKKYANQYLKKMFELLKSLGVIGVLKKFCWKIYRVVIRPLEWVQPLKKKKLQSGNSSYKTEASNDCNAAVASLQQQHSDLKLNQETLAENDINFDTKETEVLSRPHWEIRASIVLFQIRQARKHIENPEGWMRECLRNRYWESRRNYLAIVFKASGLTPYDDITGVSLDTMFEELDSLQQKTL
ncbi:MAG: hypothetical protein KME29_03810 [Calothrix sp. FI2-JRJ7]|jgi:hypothetical protein|nr:hypothetical protein [Calothrix sp. FI2-JRJ7]MBW4598746.1 hypothetical protein [Calothrix sp. FI2-JRJ7]